MSTLDKYILGELTVGDCCQEVDFSPSDMLGGVYGYPDRQKSIETMAWSCHQIYDHVKTNLGFVHPNYIVLDCKALNEQLKAIIHDKE